MLINELTFYELKSILEPIIKLEQMTDVVSKIGKTLNVTKPTRQNIQQYGNEFHLRYKGFDIFISDLRWIKNQGPCIIIQLSRQSTKFESYLYKFLPINNWFRKLACGEVINDLQNICKSNIHNIKFVTNEIEGYDANNKKKERITFWASYPSVAYNNIWDEGRDISPVLITNEYHSGKWFIMYTFNAGSFEIRNDKTALRDNWKDFIGQVSKSVNSEVMRTFKTDKNGNKSFEDWSEDMILEYGDDIIPSLKKVWQDVNN